jgi:uncharacterized protein YqeY
MLSEIGAKNMQKHGKNMKKIMQKWAKNDEKS